MSLGICVKGPEGLVLAAESRVTLGAQSPAGQFIHVNFDNATKLLSFSPPNTAVGAVTYGQAIVGKTGRTAHSFLPEFEASLDKDRRLKIDEFSQALCEFYVKQWEESPIPDYPGPNMTFVIGGYNEDEHFGRVYTVDLPTNPSVEERNPGSEQYGVTWGGQREIVDRIISGFDGRAIEIIKGKFNLNDDQVGELVNDLKQFQMPIPLQILPLQDCVNLAIFFIRTTIDAQKLTVGIRGVGGPIEVATITRREGFRYIQRKKVVGEGGKEYGLANGE